MDWCTACGNTGILRAGNQGKTWPCSRCPEGKKVADSNELDREQGYIIPQELNSNGKTKK